MGECLLLFLTHPINNEGEQESFNGKTASRFRYLQGRVAERSEATLSMEYARKQRHRCCVVFIDAYICCAKCPIQTFKSERNATLTALLSHHLPHDSVGIACQHCPINNETAMRFMGCGPIVLQSLNSYRAEIKVYTYSLLERTHEPCVPTCIRVTRPIGHFTHQYWFDLY